MTLPDSVAVAPDKSAVLCAQCAEPVTHGGVHAGPLAFCCEGCQKVYELIQQTGLCHYYPAEKKPVGNRAEVTLPELSYLEDDALARRMVDFTDGQTGIVTLRVPGIHCTSCLWLLEQLHRLDKGILSSEVNLSAKTVTVRFRWQKPGLAGVVKLLHRLGYPPALAEASDKGPQATGRQRRLVTQLGVAGFALGNLMLLAMPDYLNGSQLSTELSHVLGYVSLGLSLMLLWAAQDYFTKGWQGLRLGQFVIEQPLALGIGVMFLRSATDVLLGTGQGFFDAMGGLVFFLLLGKWLQQRTYDRLDFNRDARSYFPLGVSVIQEDGTERTAPLQGIRPGQRLAVRSGELVPTDATLLSPSADLDYSFLTGEATPVNRRAGELLYAGGRVLSGRIEVLAEAQAGASRLARLWNRPRPGAAPTDYSATVNRLSQYFTIAVLLTAGASLAYWGLMGQWARGWHAATGVLIVACPCALAFAAPFAYGTLQQWLGRRGFFLQNARVVEQLAQVSEVAFDKTGTLTNPDSASATFTPAHDPLSPEEGCWSAALAGQSVHPLSRAIAQTAAYPAGIAWKNFTEVPGQGLVGTYADVEYRLGQKDWVAPCRCRVPCQERLEAMQEAPSETRVHLSIGGRYRGYYALKPTYLPGLPQLTQRLKHLGLESHVLSGDGPAERPHLLPLFASVSFQQSPEDKLAWLEGRQQQGQRLAYLGDGLNDAAALGAAQVGIAVTGSTALFTPAAHAILLRQGLPQLPLYIKLARRSVGVVRIAFTVALLYNATGAFFAVQGVLSPVVAALLMPLSSLGTIALSTILMQARLPRRSAVPSLNPTDHSK